jgi:hypothetical protein
MGSQPGSLAIDVYSSFCDIVRQIETLLRYGAVQHQPGDEQTRRDYAA